MMLYRKITDLPENVVKDNSAYATKEWYLSIKNDVNDIIFEFFGERDLILSHDIIRMIRDGDSDNLVNIAIKNRAEKLAKLTLIRNNLSYEKIYEAITAQYNPIWNVDGTETITYTRTNTGTVDTSGLNTGTVGTTGSNTGTVGTTGSNTGTVDTSGTDTGTVGTTGSNTGTVGTTGSNTGTVGTTGSNTGTVGTTGSNTGTVGTTETNTGTVENVIAYEGDNTDTTNHTGTVTTTDETTRTHTEAVSTFDSVDWNNTSRGLDENDGDITRTDNLTDDKTAHTEYDQTETRTDNLSHSETRTDNLLHSETRTDNLAHSESVENDLTEEYEETRTRGGNIGVTMTQQLIQAQIDLYDGLSFIEMVARDVVHAIALSVYS